MLTHLGTFSFRKCSSFNWNELKLPPFPAPSLPPSSPTPPALHLQHIERCYQSRSDSLALLYLPYLLWSECEAPHIQTDERLQISVSSIRRAEQTLAQREREWGGGREAPHLQSECTRVFILTWFMITNPSNTPPLTPLKTDEWIMKLRRQQLDKNRLWNRVWRLLKSFQQEGSFGQTWALLSCPRTSAPNRQNNCRHSRCLQSKLMLKLSVWYVGIMGFFVLFFFFLQIYILLCLIFNFVLWQNCACGLISLKHKKLLCQG